MPCWLIGAGEIGAVAGGRLAVPPRRPSLATPVRDSVLVSVVTQRASRRPVYPAAKAAPGQWASAGVFFLSVHSYLEAFL